MLSPPAGAGGALGLRRALELVVEEPGGRFAGKGQYLVAALCLGHRVVDAGGEQRIEVRGDQDTDHLGRLSAIVGLAEEPRIAPAVVLGIKTGDLRQLAEEPVLAHEVSR